MISRNFPWLKVKTYSFGSLYQLEDRQKCAIQYWPSHNAVVITSSVRQNGSSEQPSLVLMPAPANLDQNPSNTLPERINELFVKKEIASVYSMTLGANHSFFISYKSTGGSNHIGLAPLPLLHIHPELNHYYRRQRTSPTTPSLPL
jgi:hypothetical protein